MTIKSFAKDQCGTMTFWMLMWSIIFIAFAGLAIDVANLYRTRAMLSATADAASHAGAIALATGGSVSAAVDAMASANMPSGTTKGVSVIDTTNSAEVFVGTWDAAARQISPGGGDPDAVYVLARRTEAASNSLDTYLLRILDFDTWNVSVASVAVASPVSGTPCGDDFPNAMVAAGMVDLQSNNAFAGKFCVHGEHGIEGQNGNVSVGEGVLFTMPNAYALADGGMWNVNTCSRVPDFGEEPIGDCYRAQGSEIPWDARSQTLETVTNAIFNDPTGYGSDYFGFAAAGANYKSVTNGNGQNQYTAAMLAADILAGKTHFRIDCTTNNNTFSFASGQQMTGITIVTDCELRSPSGPGTEGVVTNDVTIISTSTSGMVRRDDADQSSPTYMDVISQQNGSAIQIAAKPTTGGSCGDNSRRLRIYSPGTVQLAAQANFSALEIYAGGDFTFTSNAAITSTVNVYVWGDVDFNSNSQLIPCTPVLIGTGAGNPFNTTMQVNIVG